MNIPGLREKVSVMTSKITLGAFAFDWFSEVLVYSGGSFTGSSSPVPAESSKDPERFSVAHKLSKVESETELLSE